MIVARGMGVRRGGRWLLRPVTFGVPEGVVGLAGPPGAGKSTLLATFATLRRPNAGALHILGHDTANAAGLRAARAGIGYLPARFSRAEHMRAGEFVAYAAYYKRTSRSAAHSMMKRLDLAEAAGTELALLPPDVRLRAGLAAACVHEPDVVLLDDPFGELCAAAEPWPTGAAGPGGHALTAVMAELVPVLRSLAPTVIITADATATLTGWCDRLLTLARGKLTEQPTQSATARRGRTAADRRAADLMDRQGVDAMTPQTVNAIERRDAGGVDRPRSDAAGRWMADPADGRGAGRPGVDVAQRSGTDRRGPDASRRPATRPGPPKRRPARLTLPDVTLPRVPRPNVTLPNVTLPQMTRLRARRPPAGSATGV